MLKNAKPIGEEIMEEYRNNYNKSKVLQTSTHALYKNELNSVAAVMPQNGDSSFHFSVNIPTLPATNQKQSGRCWLFAGLNLLRERVAQKCNLKEFELSQNYAAFWDKFEKSNYYLESVIDLAAEEVDERTLCWVLQNGIVDGGQWDMFVSLVQKYGVVPQQNMPETANSGNTRNFNRVLLTRLTRAAAEIRRLHAEGKGGEAITNVKEQAMGDVYNILCCCFGTPPKTFAFECTDADGAYRIYRGLTPHSFYEQFVGLDLSEYASVINAPTADKPFYKTYTVDYLGNVVGGHPVHYLNLPMEEMQQLIVDTLQKGEPVWFGSDVGPYGDREGGVWDDGAFDYETMFDVQLEVSKTDALDLRLSAMGHAMLITGVSLDENGKPVKWKIENSWSDKNGDKGYYVMSASWFGKYVYQAVIHKNMLTEKQQTALRQAPVHLHPWDPMGTLALCE